MGTTTFPQPMPAKLFVGPEFSPENGNSGEDTGLRAVWLAKIREYGDVAPVMPPDEATLSFTRAANSLTLTFESTLQSADSIAGPWTDVAGASPQTVNTATGTKFYRAKK